MVLTYLPFKNIKRELDDFVKTLQFFKKLNLSHKFLSIDPVSWADRDDCQTAEKTVLTLKVVHDHAERDVALVQRYNKLLTKNEEKISIFSAGSERAPKEISGQSQNHSSATKVRLNDTVFTKGRFVVSKLVFLTLVISLA